MTSRNIFILLGATLAAGLALAANSISPVAKKFLYACGLAFRGLTPRQIESVVAITEAFRKYGDGDHRKLAYMLALAWHESRLQPIKEIRAAPGTEVYNIQNRYWGTGYYGRGYVQITWDKNYAKFSKLVGVDLVRNPDAALVPSIAARIIVIGMMQGMFTGRKLSDYINGNNADYYNARRTVGAINVAGTDTAALIVGHLKKIVSHL
jgi:putative chitinase